MKKLFHNCLILISIIEKRGENTIGAVVVSIAKIAVMRYDKEQHQTIAQLILPEYTIDDT